MSTFTIDSDVLIHLKNHYPRDVFPTIWDNFELLIEGAIVCICRFVQIEIQRGNDALIEWVDSLDGFVCDPTEAELELASVISNLFPGWVREDSNAADPFVIAHAKIKSHTVVSDENTASPSVAPQNQKLPSVAATQGVTVIKLLQFARQMNWSF